MNHDGIRIDQNYFGRKQIFCCWCNLMDVLEELRPTNFGEMVGHKPIIEALTQFFDYPDDLPHSYLFSGPSGTGKTSIARICARMICESENEGITEFSGSLLTGVDNIRELIGNAIVRNLFSNRNCIIIDECHMLSKSAWNALLTVVENPPDHLFWIFTTTEPGKVPRTIETRCRCFYLDFIPKNELMDYARYIADGFGFSEKHPLLGLCVDYSQGSVRQLINLMSKVQGLNTQDAKTLLGSISENLEPEVIDFYREFCKDKPDYDYLIGLIEKLSANNEQGFSNFVHPFRRYIRRVLLTKKTGSPQHLLSMVSFTRPSMVDDWTDLVSSLIYVGKMHGKD